MVTATDAVARLDALADKSVVYRVAEMQRVLDEDRQLLRKYIEHVVDREGVDYIFNQWGERPDRFTVEEWAELERISKELG